MKLHQLLDPYFKDGSRTVLDYSDLEVLKPLLQQCDEFKTLDELYIIKTSTFFNTQTHTPYNVGNFKVGDAYNFWGKLHLHSIEKSTGIIPKDKLTAPVKDGIVMSPMYYNSNNLEYAKRTLHITIFPTKESEDFILRKIKKALSNPSEYIPPMQYSLIMRGVLL